MLYYIVVLKLSETSLFGFVWASSGDKGDVLVEVQLYIGREKVSLVYTKQMSNN
jgi:hypothetical protein